MGGVACRRWRRRVAVVPAVPVTLKMHSFDCFVVERGATRRVWFVKQARRHEKQHIKASKIKQVCVFQQAARDGQS